MLNIEILIQDSREKLEGRGGRLTSPGRMHRGRSLTVLLSGATAQSFRQVSLEPAHKARLPLSSPLQSNGTLRSAASTKTGRNCRIHPDM